MLVFRVWIHKTLVRIAKREDPDQTATSEAVWSGSELFVLAVFQAFIVQILDWTANVQFCSDQISKRLGCKQSYKSSLGYANIGLFIGKLSHTVFKTFEEHCMTIRSCLEIKKYICCQFPNSVRKDAWSPPVENPFWFNPIVRGFESIQWLCLF